MKYITSDINCIITIYLKVFFGILVSPKFLYCHMKWLVGKQINKKKAAQNIISSCASISSLCQFLVKIFFLQISRVSGKDVTEEYWSPCTHIMLANKKQILLLLKLTFNLCLQNSHSNLQFNLHPFIISWHF